MPADPTPPTHQILDRTVTIPVRIRHATCFVAGFTADATAVSAAIARAGDGTTRLRPLQIRPGRTMCMLVFVDYIDGDLGPYNEFGVCFLVEDPADPPASRIAALRALAKGDARALIHRLPVDGEFTLAAGRGIWGFPKTLAHFDVDHDSATKHGRVSADGRLIVDVSVRKGLRVPDTSGDTVLNAYSQLDGVLRATPWRMTGTAGTRTRLGGASLTLGDHEIARELSGLKLSRRALMTSSVGHLEMSFGDAETVDPTGNSAV
ncbi:acetoacetate decarboxylase [Gordonia pseudamarae]|jgi:hypothetical protein|uniref:Acetoacetate decarboxylase n=1 Tax=Gordonia pseudamarae TaxID=2831662 RepID=A0ABX6ILT4_9ACTN|nr:MULTISPECIES: acetoacetate decarboxylase family protein [Gordonia]MBD0020590.1 acetoacetate decarboxylase family protein [Gordonia sp. (in: high G+C Gram-positive bacteria)]QHN27445.1 acetoacetate decarboxylase [Gordonia pseudamarae]QHN36329.1 acetoacetate decarboxylase [Gordonia pseudamarae]